MASVTFEPLEDGDGLVVTDAIEQRRCEFHTDEPVDAKPAPTDGFFAPLDTAVTIDATCIRFPKVPIAHVRDQEGKFVESASQFETIQLDKGTHQVEFNPPIKVYFSFDGPCRVENTGVAIEFYFEEKSPISIGARSYHKRPEFTLKTTEKPEDLMRTLSYLGCSLKTTSCERSFPTLRGHPPAIELGDSVEIPDGVEKPSTGITLQIPSKLESIFTAAPLAFYLGADIVPGSTARLVTDRGFVYPLDGVGGFERSIERVLKQVFFLDCLTRTEGLYPVSLYEREQLDDVLGFDFSELYSKSLAEQLEAYLSVPYSLVEDEIPTWKVTAHVEPEPENIETLPFLVDDLAIIRSPNVSHVTPSQAQSDAIKEFMRSEMTRSTTEPATGSSWTLVQPEQADSQEQLWIGNHAPIGANKATLQAFRNRVGQEPKKGDINITVVCNDPEMLEEHEDVRDIYGNRDDLPFKISIFEDLTTVGLKHVLETECDFFHYIGHIEDGGFKCTDGLLDLRKLDQCGINAFFLNACRSYTQGMALIERGAIGGVVTLDEVINSGAIRVGRTMAKLLNNGFPLGTALEIASEQSIVGSQYIVLGDSSSEVTQIEIGSPKIHEIESTQDKFLTKTEVFAARHGAMGAFTVLDLPNHDTGHLIPNVLPDLDLDREELATYLGVDDVPVRIQGELCWSSDLNLDEI